MMAFYVCVDGILCVCRRWFTISYYEQLIRKKMVRPLNFRFLMAHVLFYNNSVRILASLSDHCVVH